MDLLIVFVAGFVAAFIGSMAGGGAGFFGLYPLIFLGLPLNVAIATNRVGGLGFYIAPIRNFSQKGLVKRKVLLPMLILGGLGAALGTFLLIDLSANGIRIVVTLVTVPIFFLMAFKPPKTRSKQNPLWAPTYFLSALYSGIQGAGAGFIRMFALINLRKIPPLEAAANGFAAAFPFAVLSAGALLIAGLVDLRLTLPLFAGNLIGGHFGSKIAIQKGNKFVRYMLLTLMVATLVIIWIKQ